MTNEPVVYGSCGRRPLEQMSHVVVAPVDVCSLAATLMV